MGELLEPAGGAVDAPRLLEDGAHLHAHATREIADAHAAGRHDTATRLAEGWNRADGLFGALDARRLPR